jgi:hypothetical protein
MVVTHTITTASKSQVLEDDLTGRSPQVASRLESNNNPRKQICSQRDFYVEVLIMIIMRVLLKGVGCTRNE